MITARTTVPWSTRARAEHAAPLGRDARLRCSRPVYCAVREIVTTRRRDIQSNAMMASTNGAEER